MEVLSYSRWLLPAIYFFTQFSSLTSQAFKYDYNWLMSDYTRNIMVLNFHNPVDSSSISLDSVKKFVRFVTGAMISDTGGILKAYSNGCVINNSKYEIMENGDDINAGINRKETCAADFYPAGEQGAVIIPDPGSSSRYYLIHSSEVVQDVPLKGWIDAIRYTTIDLSYNNGFGKVVEKNIPILHDSSTLADIAIVKHSNNSDYWILVKKYFVGSYDRFLIDKQGIRYVGNQNIGDTTNRYEDGGGVVHIFSPHDGSKMLRYHPYDDGFYIYDFDRSNGKLSNFKRIDVIDSLLGDGGACFSPNGRFLYIGTYWDLYQYDLEATDIKASEVHIAHYDGYLSKGRFPAMIGKMQWGPDCKIYINCRSSMDALHVINKPDLKGLACDYRPHSLALPQTHTGSIPYFPNYRLGIAPLCDPNLSVSVSEVPFVADIQIYPNPASYFVHFSFREFPALNSWLKIFDITGTLKSMIRLNPYTNEYHLDLKDFNSGVYVCKYQVENGSLYSSKLFVK